MVSCRTRTLSPDVPLLVRSLRQVEGMPPKCSICGNEARDEINSALLSATVSLDQ
jgi:hypothetical protein